MKHITHLIILLALLAPQLSAGQGKIYFCSNYTSTGQPSGTSYSWEIRPEGGKISLLYANDSANIGSTVLYIYIDRHFDGEYLPVATKRIVAEKSRNWAAYDHIFDSPGNYRVTFADASKKVLASGHCSIVLKRNGLTSQYYSGATMSFCADTGYDGRCTEPLFTFSIEAGGGYGNVVVEHASELSTTSLIFDIYRGEDFSEFLESKTISVSSNSKVASFQYTFNSPGVYKFKVYNKDEVFITSAVAVVTLQ